MKNSNDEKRKTKSEPSRPAVFFLRLLPAGIFFLAAGLVCAILFADRPLTADQQEFVLDEPAVRSYFAPFSFSYVDAKKTEELRSSAAANVPPVYRVDDGVNKKVFERVDRFFQIIAEAKQEQLQNGQPRWKTLPLQIPTSSLNSLLDTRLWKEVKTHTTKLLAHYLSQGVLSFRERARLLQSGESSILLVAVEGATRAESRKLEGVLTKSSILEEAAGRLSGETMKTKGARHMILQVLEAALSENLVLDSERTQRLRKKAAETVAPVEIKIKKNELIAQRGMLVTREIKDRLDKIHGKMTSQKKRTRTIAGAFFIFLFYGMSFLYFRLFERKIISSYSKLLLCHTVILLSVSLCKAVSLWPDASIYLMPTALAPLLLTLLVNNRISLWAGGMMTVLVGFLSGFHAGVMFGTLLVSASVVFLTYHVRKRVHFLRVGLGMGTVYFLAIWGFQLAQSGPARDSFHLAALGFAGALVTAVLSFLLLPILEMFFDVITDVTLLELSDLNHPLIRKMMVQAPGTYHHSVVVSSLAEHACEVIGANALLAKVGCYFHDIGKIERPEYFSENQGYLYPNLHEQLPPRMSYEIIVNHVRQGLRLGREYKLKNAIKDFIAEHQGTGVVYYFYKQALDQALPREHVRADDYRYPGPKPQSRETAVVLLSDSVEAASRSLKDPVPDACRQLVRKIINEKFVDGQLDECELTLLDLHNIQDSFVRDLTGMFHTRMKYPVIEKVPGAPDLFQENQFAKFRVTHER